MAMNTLDTIMDQASVALAEMDYLTCEARCLAAMEQAKAAGNWRDYARIVLPLQEARRQRRMIAAEGVIRLGSSAMTEPWPEMPAGCVVLTAPYGAADAAAMQGAARRERRHVEVLWIDNDSRAEMWMVRSFAGMAAEVSRPAPPRAWRERWLEPGTILQTPGPVDWVMDAMESLGEAAMAQVRMNAPTVQRIEELEACLAAVSDHERIHQRLWEAAHAARC
ncbi:MAG: hypothetical protein IT440_05355 [Phycisphaeraceae bacterium]|nr:hypothetical protein [Phycisphaeraceae bacterium]